MTRIVRAFFATVILAATLSAQTTTTPALRTGISVNMASTSHAKPVPEADDENAWIVSIVRDGALYFGIQMVSAPGLLDAMKSTPRNREQKLYVKADARVPFSEVRRVLEEGREAYFEAPVLLTSQPRLSTLKTVIPPTGLAVWVGPVAATNSINLQLLDSGRESPTIKINDLEVPTGALQSTLVQLLRKESDKAVVLKASGELHFSQVAHVIDLCESTGARVVLAHPEL